MNRLRLIVTLLGVFFTVQGLGFLLAPQRAVESLGMPLLDGLARSTQLGDFAAFFLVGGLSILYGSRPGNARALLFPAALIGGAAVTRTLAWLLQGADFAGMFIAVEVITGVLLYRAAETIDSRL
ncbi:hypothetical protein K2Z84_33315 [Candidatus Binatia bacterium]|jgi:hypothetical protein|nr:hypothetical protein [Candidatus Binatia bacterium]